MAMRLDTEFHSPYLTPIVTSYKRLYFIFLYFEKRPRSPICVGLAAMRADTEFHKIPAPIIANVSFGSQIPYFDLCDLEVGQGYASWNLA